MRRFLLAPLAFATLLSCQQPLGVDDALDPSLQISDAAHAPGVVEHFYFLPPMVPEPVVDGDFDSTRSPSVRICLLDTDANKCAPAAEQPTGFPILYTEDSGPGSETVRLSVEDEHYLVNWHTDQFALDPDATYRITIRDPGPIGFADVDAVSGGNQLRNVNTDDYIALLDGRTLPIRFRIEEGLAFALDAEGGQITAAGGQVELDVPANAVPNEEGEDPVQITVDQVEADDPSLPVGASGLEGTVYDLGPDGTVFAQPVELTFTYDPDVLAAANPDAREEDLALFVLESGIWVPLENGAWDPDTKTVSGTTTHFSQFGILTKTRVCAGGGGSNFPDVQQAYDATIPGGAIELCGTSPHQVEGVVLDAPVTVGPRGNENPVIQTDTARAAFWVNGYGTGTVLIDGIAFDFNSPDGVDIPTRSYAIRAQQTYDQLIVQKSTFDIDPGSRGSIFVEGSTTLTAATLLDSVEVVGGVYGFTIADSHGEVTNSSFTGVVRSVYYFDDGSPNPTTGLVQSSSFADCGNMCVALTEGTVADVADNDFGFCGNVRCVLVTNGSTSDVTGNTFAAQTLTGDPAPDPDQVVAYGASNTGTVDGNVFLGCGYFECVLANGTMTVSNNQFTHVAGSAEQEYAAIVSSFRGVDVLVENNTINSCASFACYKIGDGSNITIRNETVSVPSGHGTDQVLHSGRNPEWEGAGNTIAFEDNVITGSGQSGDPGDHTTYPARHGLGVWHGQVTAERNAFVQVGVGVAVGGEASLVGRDNTFDQTSVAIQADPAPVEFRFNDFTNQVTDIAWAGAGHVLTCNYWGSAVGPEGVDPGLDRGVYWPWALQPIAGTGATDCDGATLRVAAADDGSGLPFVPTVADAVSAVPPDGQILVSDGTHPVEEVALDRSMTISGEGSGAIIQTDVARAAFLLDGYSSGTVVIDGLTFDMNTPNGPDLETRTYPIRAQGTYDQLIVRNVTFDIDPVSRGSIYSRLSSVTGAGTYVENTTFSGGAYGIVAENAHVEVVGSTFGGYTATGVLYYDATPIPSSGRVEGSNFLDCGQGRCISAQGGSSVDILGNTFAAPVLTGDVGPDANQVVQVAQSASGLVDGNTFNGCGFFDCIRASSGTTATISNNEFTHVAGQSEWDYSDIIVVQNGASPTIEYNTLHSCGVICYKILDGSMPTIRNETITIPAGHGTQQVLITAEDDPAFGPHTVTFENNMVTGSGSELGLGFYTETNATVNGNTFAGFASGVEVHDNSTLTGRDNVFTLNGTAVSVFVGSADFRFNDFSGQSTDIGGGGEGSSDLTCNYWGNVAGPQSVIGGIPDTVYTPWADAPVAGTLASGCSGSE
ncbi:MAG TPA: right-handed parallel beta-helix repeat-containing protein [Longimicrobiales bacterium]|nr:right-handed parallel beta-helix repeat-containing protein [Longimicrobiales bacterium]